MEIDMKIIKIRFVLEDDRSGLSSDNFLLVWGII